MTRGSVGIASSSPTVRHEAAFQAFFHPDAWTFGQALHASQILGRIQALPGVEHVRQLSMKRWNDAAPPQTEVIKVRGNEIILVNSDPDCMEEGFIDFDLRGGRG